MASPQRKRVLSALGTAVQMEADGKAFYLKAREESTNEAGKRLLSQLADEEDAHRRVFEQIYEALRSDNRWPEIELKPHTEAKTILAEEVHKIVKAKRTPSNEIDVVKTALEMEGKSCDFYTAQLKTVDSDVGRRFYEALAAQERGHRLVLLDFLEFLQDPSSYHAKMERHSLDGG